MIKWLGQFIVLSLLSMFSPAWFLMKEALKGYFNLEKAMTSPQQMMTEFIQFNLIVKRYPEEVLFSLLPKMILILAISILFALLISYVCKRITYIFNKRIICRLSS